MHVPGSFQPYLPPYFAKLLLRFARFIVAAKSFVMSFVVLHRFAMWRELAGSGPTDVPLSGLCVHGEWIE